MKAVISKNDLVNVIGKIQSIVPAKPSVPILGNVLLEATEGQLIVSGTDLTVSMRCSIEAKVIEEGAIALPARRFFQLIRELTASQVKISVEEQLIAEITTGTSLFKINGMSKQEFPELPNLEGAPEISVDYTELKELLNRTVFSAAKEDSRYMLNGVQVQVVGQKATFIGTDGKRLAKMETTIQENGALQGSYVIPLKAVEEMIKSLHDSEEQATLTLTQDKVALEAGPLTLIAKLLSGQYPDVERVIPTHIAHQFSVHREELMTLLKQLALFTSETSNSVRFSFETGQLHLSAMSSEIGEGKVSMPVDYSADPLEVAFNPFYFLDILRHSKEETVQFGLNDAHNPGLITDSTSALFVIMPMRLNEMTPQETTPVPARA